MGAGRADQVLRVFGNAIVVPVACGVVLPLGDRVGAACGNGREFIFANTTVDDFVETSLGIKKPLSAVLYERNGSGPIVFANGDGVPGIVDFLQLSRFADSNGELVAILGVLDVVAGKKLVIVWAEDLREDLRVLGLDGGNQSPQGVIGRGKSALCGRLSVSGRGDGKKTGRKE